MNTGNDNLFSEPKPEKFYWQECTCKKNYRYQQILFKKNYENDAVIYCVHDQLFLLLLKV